MAYAFNDPKQIDQVIPAPVDEKSVPVARWWENNGAEEHSAPGHGGR